MLFRSSSVAPPLYQEVQTLSPTSTSTASSFSQEGHLFSNKPTDPRVVYVGWTLASYVMRENVAVSRDDNPRVKERARAYRRPTPRLFIICQRAVYIEVGYNRGQGVLSCASSIFARSQVMTFVLSFVTRMY